MYPPLPSIPIGSAELNAYTTTSDGPTDTAHGNDSAEPQIPQTPQVTLTFLLVSGRRKTQSFDPQTTVGRVKELVWNAWPARDAGKILQDDDTLLPLSYGFVLGSQPRFHPHLQPLLPIVHLSIRPYAPPSEDPALSKKHLRRLSTAFGRRAPTAIVEDPSGNNAERTGCCGGCVIC
ncbi:hypothetical protein BU15DRAFT_61430 [Melanogaster broomeanus]|nr:hypothetical protein BU15DRAFT_61430 [Melanogaster broomeanus]